VKVFSQPLYSAMCRLVLLLVLSRFELLLSEGIIRGASIMHPTDFSYVDLFQSVLEEQD